MQRDLKKERSYLNCWIVYLVFCLLHKRPSGEGTCNQRSYIDLWCNLCTPCEQSSHTIQVAPPKKPTNPQLYKVTKPAVPTDSVYLLIGPPPQTAIAGLEHFPLLSVMRHFVYISCNTRDCNIARHVHLV